jgi:CubicO group peptidase (beta-lactamase class C family)
VIGSEPTTATNLLTDSTSQALDVAALEATLNQELTRHRLPGAAIAIVKDDRVVYTKAFGVANVETGERVRPDTVFAIGSLTKALTSTALVSLAVNGKLRLDEPVGTYVQGLAPPISRLTTGQLLSHTSGLVADIVAPTPAPRDESALVLFPRTWPETALFAEPGRIFSVSNSGYQLAGAALEMVTKTPYADAMKAQVFSPLGMTATSLRASEAITRPFAQGYTRETTGELAIVRQTFFPLYWPSGSVYSTVGDLSRFMIAFLNGGQLDGKQVLDPRVITEMTTPHATVPTRVAGAYGYGLFLDMIRGVKVWQHGGQRQGYGATIRMAPDQRVGVVILANQYGAEMPETAMKAMELMLPLKPAEPVRPALTTTPDDLRRHVGIYRNLTYEIEILSKDGQLIAKQGQLTQPLIKRSEVQFDANPSNSFVFTSDSDGVTRYVSLGNRSYSRAR